MNGESVTLVLHRASIVWILCILLHLFCASLHGDDGPPEVRQVDKAYRQAMNAGEMEVLQRLITDDFMFIRRTGEIWDKKTFLQNVSGRKLQVQEKDLSTRMYGDTAILTHKDSLKTTEGVWLR